MAVVDSSISLADCLLDSAVSRIIRLFYRKAPSTVDAIFGARQLLDVLFAVRAHPLYRGKLDH